MRGGVSGREVSAWSWRQGGLSIAVALFLVGLPGGDATAIDSAADGLSQIARVARPAAILSGQDAARYARIFRLQTAGKWRAADREIKRLGDRILMGHVLFQRYMHPTAYRSSYPELHQWLKKYNDHPGAARLYRLAQRRHLSNWKRPTRPVAPPLGAARAAFGDARSAKPLPGQKARGAIRLPRRINAKLTHYLRRGRPDLAEHYLKHKSVRRTLSRTRLDHARARTASGYFYKGQDAKALALAQASAERSRRRVPLADWTAGLAAWRSGDFRIAASHFEWLARSKAANSWTLAAGAYWAARAAVRTGRPEAVYPLLARAAAEPRTFYGLLAARQLALSPGLSWRPPPLSRPELDALMRVAAVRRAVALAEAAQSHLAAAELRRLAPRVGSALGDAIFGLATRIGAPATAMRIARVQRDRYGVLVDAALYPLLARPPAAEFAVDQALVHALVRQESQFKATARSRAGARGLMQLMPRTASFIGADRSLRWSKRAALYSPDLNLALGQKYLKHLLRHKVVGQDLIRLVVAYNGGPGNLRKWLKRVRHQDDPLLFIEAIPSAETRNFAERVLANLWIYRLRLGQTIPSLDAIAAGDWPQYVALDDTRPLARAKREEAHAD